MPVVDNAHRLVGAVTVDDVLDHSLPRGWRARDAEAIDEQRVDL
jgi:CBS domain-containing protein